ncbi:RDD family protein [Aciduricibacillus chroicocephali]|uniref:RDD family protein n=1 Tax=Aciduricibacillus chroicocephali TaxID=3054939 RepID=A0ABY9KVZ5_9BACI|nr:RDD family protein [Bacillaceae bacterium 44XB]
MSEEVIQYTVAPAPPEPPRVPVRYAGFWIRFWAYVTDLIIVGAINGIILLPFIPNGGREFTIGFWTLTGVISTIVLYLYFLLMTKFSSQTLGKMIFGIKVIRKDGNLPSWSDLVFREIVGRFLHRVLVVTNLLYIVVGFAERKKGIHDMIADTRVIHTNK